MYRDWKFRYLLAGIILTAILSSCNFFFQEDPVFIEDTDTICEFLNKNEEKYSKFLSLLEQGNMLIPLCGYNPHGEFYTLFLPTNEAIDRYIQQNPNYSSFEALLQDTGFVDTLTRYHVVNKEIHTNQFPDGALKDTTLVGQRLTINFDSDGDIPFYLVNNVARIVTPNIETTNGMIHVISSVLDPVFISGYDWLQQQEEYSILAEAMDSAGIKDRLNWDKYTILAEHDSIYKRAGIDSIAELIDSIADPDRELSSTRNPFYKFAAAHIIQYEYFLNDFEYGIDHLNTLGSEKITIDAGLDIRINPGDEAIRYIISESGDTTEINYISFVWEACNNLSRNGPIHSISELLNRY